MRSSFDGRVAGAVAFIVVCLGIAVWFLAFASGDPEPEPTATATAAPTPSPRTEPSATPSATETPTASATPTVEYTPSELPIGDDLEQVVQTIFDIRHDAFTRGDPTILGQIYDSRCTCSTTEQAAIRDQVERELTFRSDPPRVSELEVVQRPDATSAIVRARVLLPLIERLDATGEVVESVAERDIVIEMAIFRDLRPGDSWIALSSDRVAR